jgi:hypothetical protein
MVPLAATVILLGYTEAWLKLKPFAGPLTLTGPSLLEKVWAFDTAAPAIKNNAIPTEEKEDHRLTINVPPPKKDRC